jgi:hypothetical protein
MIPFQTGISLTTGIGPELEGDTLWNRFAFEIDPGNRRLGYMS